MITEIIYLITVIIIFFSINNLKLETMANFQAVKDAVAALQTSVDAKQEAIAKAIADLKEQIVNGATAEQLQEVVDNLTAVQTDVDSTPTA